MADAKRELWTKLVADFELSGQTQHAFAGQREIDLSRLRYWIYKFRNESRPLAVGADSPSVKPPEQDGPEKAPRMLPVRVVASPAPKAREAAAGAMLLELALPSGAYLRFPPGTDLAYLRQLAAAL